MPIELTATGQGYYRVYVDENETSKHTTEREAIEQAVLQRTVNPDSEVQYRHDYTVRVVGSVADAQTGDTEPPTVPGSVTATAVSTSTINVSWSPSSDNVGVVGYQVFRDGTPVGGVVTITSYVDGGLTANTTYSYTIVAIDAAGNVSGAGGPAQATTNATNNPPVWSLGAQSGQTGEAVSISLDAFCSDTDGDTLNYSLQSGTLPTGLSLSGARNETLSGTLTEADVDVFTLRATDGQDTADVEVTYTVTAADTTPPGAPTGLLITSTGTSFVALDWNDNSEGDLRDYTVYRSLDGTNFGVRQAGVTSSAYTDTGLSSNTQYWYYVTATDNNNNESADSSTVNGTTDPLTAGSVSFNGNVAGTGTGFNDKIRVQVDQPGNPANLFSGDGQIDVWLRPSSTANNNVNPSFGSYPNEGSGVTANQSCIFVDGDVFGSPQGGWFAGLSEGRVVWTMGQTSGGQANYTIAASTDLRDDSWHHIRLVRQAGYMAILVDGVREVFTNSGPTGDCSIPDNISGSTSWPNSDPYIVLGSEKHDVAPADELGYYGEMYDIRFSSIARDLGATADVPSAPLDTDGNTVLHYRLNQTAGPSADLAAANTPGFNNEGIWRVSSQGYPQSSAEAPSFSGNHNYFDLLVAQPQHVVNVPLRGSDQAITNSRIRTGASNYNPLQWTWDPTNDAARALWEADRGDGRERINFPAYHQIKFGDSPDGYNQEVDGTGGFGTLGTDTLLTYWETRVPSNWVSPPLRREEEQFAGDDNISNHKAFQWSDGGNLLLEVRHRYYGTGGGFPGPSSANNEVCGLDVRTYSGGSDGVADRLAGILASPRPRGDEWYRCWGFIEGQTGDFSFWVALQNEAPVQMYEQQGGMSTTRLRGINEFWIEYNTSQDGGNGLGVDSYFWNRNYVQLRGLTYAQVVALVAQNQW